MRMSALEEYNQHRKNLKKKKLQAKKELVICPHAGFCIDGNTCVHAKFHENDHRLYGCLGNDRINCPACISITPLH